MRKVRNIRNVRKLLLTSIILFVACVLSGAESKSLGLVLDTSAATIYEFGFTNDIVTENMAETVEQVDRGELVKNADTGNYENFVSFFWRILSLDKFRLKMSRSGNFGDALAMTMGDIAIKADTETVVKDNLGGTMGMNWGVQPLRFIVSSDIAPSSYTETITLTIESME